MNGLQTSDDLGRDRGMLTKADRKWLVGDTEYEHRQTASNRKSAIRDRVVDTLLDFSFLVEHMDGEDGRPAVSELLDPDDERRPALERGIQDMHAFALGAVRHEGDFDRFGRGYEAHAETGIAKGESEYFDRLANVEVSIEPRPSACNERLHHQWHCLSTHAAPVSCR